MAGKKQAQVKGGRVFQQIGLAHARAYAVTEAETAMNHASAVNAMLMHGVAPAPALLAPASGQAAENEWRHWHFANAQVTVVEDRRNSMTVDVAGAGGKGEALVVFTRPWFPGYHAVCDGKSVPVEVYDLFMPAVRLPAGVNGRVVQATRSRGSCTCATPSASGASSARAASAASTCWSVRPR